MPDDLRAAHPLSGRLFLIQADDLSHLPHDRSGRSSIIARTSGAFPRENYADETVPMQPYYVIMRLPGETHDEYILMLPMVPQGGATT